MCDRAEEFSTFLGNHFHSYYVNTLKPSYFVFLVFGFVNFFVFLRQTGLKLTGWPLPEYNPPAKC